ncbi:MAG: YfcE family phosphodiesterase [Clostridiales bacterium]|jgi:putative phosphoesterase|nr:YfcE family phosphodiesterase [Clostridiales bacterium]
MKILVFSDSHGVTKLMMDIVGNYAENLACVMFLGDYLRDIEKVSSKFQDITFHAVPGNCDFYSNLSRELTLEADGKKIWLTHGDRFGVKSGYAHIEAAAAARGADICLFGHSHKPIVYEKKGTVFLNPGSITEPRGPKRKSYAVLEIFDGEVFPKIVEVLTVS